MFFFGSARRNQPVRLDSLKTSQTRYPSPTGSNDAGLDGYSRLSTADPSGNRQPIGGTPVYPPYHDDP